ncbi:membrane bound O-acyltransferase protein [Melampsora larici-populina 98AG31]|uniref:Membrane bound O-acyltransferase protein n=1 Tax=Melampsora larici-populina (strain 98AG31 / pathotype 3-4-7) TaxID=747676 RepID=F4SE55_MELLP|nr:membrane bound O-acyltransferase protein [Melampsora larici-populina 98AG31]EGF97071.1 membrane bound O-acyltransferase protein [Melampsora larici-populina 98AG31]
MSSTQTGGWWLIGSALTGVAPDILKLLSSLLISIPLSIPIPHLQKLNPIYFHIYSISISIYFLTGIFNLKSGFIQLLLDSLITYFICQHYIIPLSQEKDKDGSKKSKAKRMVWGIFAGLLTHLTFNHSKRIIWKIPYETVEITGAQMVLVMKLSTFTWNVYDGHHRSKAELDSYQSITSITKLPSLLEFLSYCFFFPCLLVGPAIPFKDYMNFYSRNNLSSPNRFQDSFKSLILGFGFAGLVGIYGSTWSYEKMLEDQFLNKSWIQRFLHVQIAGFMARSRYYLVWLFAQASVTISGCGYNPMTLKSDIGQNIDITKIEFAQNYKGIFDHWNMKTNIWLRETVYKRVSELNIKESDGKVKVKKPGFGSTMATFAASAAWHGPLPAYFFVFLSGGVLQALARSIRRSIRPFFLNSSSTLALKSSYDFLSLILTQTNLNYLVIPFVLLDLKKSYLAYRLIGFYGHLSVGILLIFLWGFGFEKVLIKKLSNSSDLVTKNSINSTTSNTSVENSSKLGITDCMNPNMTVLQ